MTFPELTAFARHLEACSPDDLEEHENNRDLLGDLCAFVRSKDVPEISACLEGAHRLLELLAEPTRRVDRAAVQRIATDLIGLVESAITRRPAQQRVPPPEPEEPELLGELELVDAGESEPPRLQGIRDMVLGTMLIELGHATRDQVAAALRMHRRMGLPVGECMLLSGATSPDHLLETLALQRKLRAEPEPQAPRKDERLLAVDRKVREKQAEMARAYGVQTPAEVKPGMRVTEAMFLGEVLLGAGLITNEALEEAMHLHHLEGLQVGQALLRLGALSEEDLEHGLELHKKLRHVAGLKAS